ncbi:hypothetical protein VH571_14980 [Frondihabitans sp. 4ASC-45]|uniref:hypothetical protein n=1 Tax=Frondihabitans sp. 4ASC-45 TaxID=3111636 RepID=UPI003C1B8890
MEPVEDNQPGAVQPPAAGESLDVFKENDALYWLGRYAQEAYSGLDSSDAQHGGKENPPRVNEFDFDGVTLGAITEPVTWTSENLSQPEKLSGYGQELKQCIPRANDRESTGWRPKKALTVITRNLVGTDTSKVDASRMEEPVAPETQTAFEKAISAATDSKFGTVDETSASEFDEAVASAWADALGDLAIIRPFSKTFAQEVPADEPALVNKCVKMVTEFYQFTRTATANVWQKIDGDFSFQLLRDAEDKTPAGFGRFKSYKVTMSPATAIFGLSTGELPNQSKSIYQPYLAPSADRLKARTADFPSGEFRVVEEPGRPATVEVHRTVEVRTPIIVPKTSFYVRNYDYNWDPVNLKPEPQYPFKMSNPWAKEPYIIADIDPDKSADAGPQD